MNQPETMTQRVSQQQADRLLASAPLSKRIGILCDGHDQYLVLYKSEHSKKPLAKVPMLHAMYLIGDYVENVLPNFEKH